MQKNNIIIISLLVLMLSIVLKTSEVAKAANMSALSIKNININDMSKAKVSIKKKKKNDKSSERLPFKDMSITKEQFEDQSSSIDYIEPMVNKPKWRLPTEIGSVSRYETPYHMAIDITSYRGYNEPIYPIADGEVINIYRDYMGAKIVIIKHNVDGVEYSSQYVHLSSYANGLYVGKHVTTNDVIGMMGSTGYSTGPHLHIAVAECRILDPTDANCGDWNRYEAFSRRRYSQGFYGLSSLINVPNTWYSR